MKLSDHTKEPEKLSTKDVRRKKGGVKSGLRSGSFSRVMKSLLKEN